MSDSSNLYMQFNDNGCGYMIIPHSIIPEVILPKNIGYYDFDWKEQKIKELSVATEFIKKSGIRIKRGDLVRFERSNWTPSEGSTIVLDPEGSYYRNTDLYIWNGQQVIKLDDSLYDYGNLNNEFLLYEEPEYFIESYWHKHNRMENPLCKGKFSNPYIDFFEEWVKVTREMIDNITCEETLMWDNKKQMIFYSHWRDNRQNKHYIIFDTDDENVPQGVIVDYLQAKLSSNQPLNVIVTDEVGTDFSDLRNRLIDANVLVHYIASNRQ